MDSKKSSSALLFLYMNQLLFFALANGCYFGCNSPTPKPDPNPNPNPNPVKGGTCPRDALKLGICAKLLNGNIGAEIGAVDHPCCSALGGLLDLEAAICLCTALKANILGININIPISLTLLINTCGKTLPKDFICASN